MYPSVLQLVYMGFLVFLVGFGLFLFKGSSSCKWMSKKNWAALPHEMFQDGRKPQSVRVLQSDGRLHQEPHKSKYTKSQKHGLFQNCRYSWSQCIIRNFFFAERTIVEIFWPNRYVNASYQANFAVYLSCTLQLHVWGCLCWEWSQWNSFKSGHYIPHVKFYPIIRTQNSLWEMMIEHLGIVLSPLIHNPTLLSVVIHSWWAVMIH